MILVRHHTPDAVTSSAKVIIAGTMRYAELKPNLPNLLFPPAPIRRQDRISGSLNRELGMNVSRKRTKSGSSIDKDPKGTSSVDEFFDADIDDRDMVEAGKAS